MNEAARSDSGSTVLMSTASANGVQELFVINLCASMTPMPAVPKNLKGFEKYKLYQVSRQEDGRRRFRLRLGFFTSEADAEWVLNSVRSLYPAAFTGCVTQEDLRYTGDAQPIASSVKPTTTVAQPVTPVARPAAPAAAIAPARPMSPPAAAPRPATATVTAATSTTNTATSAPKATTAPAVAQPSKPAAAAVVAPKPEPARAAAPPLTASTPAVTPQPAADARGVGQPFHVGRGVELPDIDLELTDEYATLPAPPKPAMAPTAPQVSQPTAATPRTATPATSTPRTQAPIHSASFIAPPKVVDDYVPILDTTLTIRTLTKTEAEDPNRPKWFAVQLALSEQPINLDTMPKLDIFAAYSLYCVATMEDGSVKHALRLGFFRESVSAEAVMGYLKAFFNQPSINQISTAEYERFADSKPNSQPVELPGAKVVNLQTKRPTAPLKPIAPAAAQTPVKPAAKPVTGAKPRVAPPPARPQSFLSRLIGRQLD